MPQFFVCRWARIISVIAVASFFSGAHAATAASVLIGPAISSPGDLSHYHTPETAAAIAIDALHHLDTGHMGFLGATVATNTSGQLVVTAVAPDSPALKAGVEVSDTILSVNGETIHSPDAFRELVESNQPGATIKLQVRQGKADADLTAELAPLGLVGRSVERIRLGVATSVVRTGSGARVEIVDPNSPGASAGLTVGDVIFRVNGTPVTRTNTLADLLAAAPIADESSLIILGPLGGETLLRVKLGPPYGADRPASDYLIRASQGRRGYGARSRRDSLRVAIVGLEFPDVRHNPRVTARDWTEAFFSTNTYHGLSATGQPVHGSVNDFYLEQSAGALRVQGKMLDWIELTRPRASYSTAPPTTAGAPNSARFTGDGPLMTEALQKLTAREGPGIFTNYDGFFFLYAGDVAARNDGDVYWPHTSITSYAYRPLRYSISFEGGDRMADISLLCHELGHILGLPDLYVRPQPALAAPGNAPTPAGARPVVPPFRNANPYADTLANWDLMAIQSGFGRPEHMSAWSKEQLGWIHPVVINPRVPQDLILAPIEDSSSQCFKIPLRPDGSEYLLLENRRRIGFDESLPGEGLLIWRVVYGRPVLEEAHGYTGPNAATVSPTRIPYPTDRNNSFTPFSTPSSAAHTGDELPVYLNNIRRLPDGRIAFSIGKGYL